MEIKSLKCPECGANILMHENEEVTFCSHCGTQLHISPYTEHKKYEFSYSNKAKIKRMEMEERQAAAEKQAKEHERSRREEKLERKKVSITVLRIIRWGFVVLLLLLVAFSDTLGIPYSLDGNLRRFCFLGYIVFLAISLVNRFI